VYRQITQVLLKTGEYVEAGVVTGPDLEWADKIESLLGHKGEVWRWGNEMVLRHDLGLDVLYYILHRDGIPFSNMMTIESGGVGLFGHVFTRPEERQKGAASALMSLVMDDFHIRGGQALFLGTGYDTHPYHLYAKNGFVGVEPLSGLMAHYRESEEDFYAAFFNDDDLSIETLGWQDWPLSVPLFCGDFGCAVRSHVMKRFGRSSTEGPLLSLLQDEGERAVSGDMPRSKTLRLGSGGVAGFATTGRHPLWPAATLVDLYCHPNWWGHADDLLASLDLSSGNRYLAYADVDHKRKQDVLRAAGFNQVATYVDRVPLDIAQTRYAGVTEWERRD